MNVKDFGAKGDVKTVYDGSIEAGTTSLTSDSAPFTDDDHNKEIGIEGVEETVNILLKRLSTLWIALVRYL